MKFLVEVQLKPGMKNQAVEAFEFRGPNRTPNVEFVNAWLGATEEIAFVLIDSPAESHVSEAARAWSHFGEARIHHVVDIENY
jgi:hypothetical protein